MPHDTIIVLDYGSQTAQLIARRVREAGVYSEIFPWDTPEERIMALNPKGFILSGSHFSVYELDAPTLRRYVLDSGLPMFRALRDLWDHNPQGQPLLALSCAIARDPSLRTTAEVILDAPAGSTVTSEMLARAVEQQNPGRLMTSTLAKIGRNTPDIGPT